MGFACHGSMEEPRVALNCPTFSGRKKGIPYAPNYPLRQVACPRVLVGSLPGVRAPLLPALHPVPEAHPRRWQVPQRLLPQNAGSLMYYYDRTRVTQEFAAMIHSAAIGAANFNGWPHSRIAEVGTVVRTRHEWGEASHIAHHPPIGKPPTPPDSLLPVGWKPNFR